MAERFGERILFPTVSWKRLAGPGKWILLALLVAGAVVHEMRSSALQSRVLHYWSEKMTYEMETGPSNRIVFPAAGPSDYERGYARLPELTARLEREGFRIREQARFSSEMALAARMGISPPYREDGPAGLVIHSREGGPLFVAVPARHSFSTYDEIPPLVANTLAFIENRDLGRTPVDNRANPVLDWNRLGKAGMIYLARKIGLPVHQEGGSTLATQIEKYQHSPYGRTSSALDKFRQMLSASLKVYREGTDTRLARQEILLDYLNTVPLAAAPGYGEIEGFGEGLYAWFGADLSEVLTDLSEGTPLERKALAYRRILTLLCSSRAPSYYLIQDRPALETRVNLYLRLLPDTGIISRDFAKAVGETSPAFAPAAPIPVKGFSSSRKTTNAVRTHLLQLLGISSLYELDRLHLEADTTIDEKLQERTDQLMESLKNRSFLAAHGLLGEQHLLAQGDPQKVNYAMMLFERRPDGNLLRVHTDSLAQPLDVNEGAKLQLGSTAKLRTLAHYLGILAGLHEVLSVLPQKVLQERAAAAKDPITQWAANTLLQQRGLSLEDFLRKSLDRTYSANPDETFFTGGGSHTFVNFEPEDNGRILTIREGFARSVNLVFIRLMRDIEKYHERRLPYDPDAVMSDVKNPVRRQLLEEVAEGESQLALADAYKTYGDLPPEARTTRLLGSKESNPRALALLWFAWHPDARRDPGEPLDRWLSSRSVTVSPQELRRLIRAYGNPRLTLADYGYLLGVRPLDLWCVGQLAQNGRISWSDLLSHSADVRRVSSTWLFNSRNRHAQDLRLREQIERDAFQRMTPYWQRLGFPFDHLIPSLATAIGSSSDRPAALAELMGIIVNDGVRRPTIRMRDLSLAAGTPYHTVFEMAPPENERVMPQPVAHILRMALAGVVENGTAIRVKTAFKLPNGRLVAAGAKTGSGDNRFEVFGRNRQLIDSRPVNRTATLVFYVGNRYFGVITAYVMGREAGNYRFTSSLPTAILRLMAPVINPYLAQDESSTIRSRDSQRASSGNGKPPGVKRT